MKANRSLVVAAVTTSFVLAGIAVSHQGARVPATAPTDDSFAMPSCVESAALIHDLYWAAACMSLAESEKTQHAQCLRERLDIGDADRRREHCDKAFAWRDDSTDCTLPSERAATLHAGLKAAEDRCMAEGTPSALRRRP